MCPKQMAPTTMLTENETETTLSGSNGLIFSFICYCLDAALIYSCLCETKKETNITLLLTCLFVYNIPNFLESRNSNPGVFSKHFMFFSNK